MESQRERTPHVTDTPRCRLSLNDLEQMLLAVNRSNRKNCTLHVYRLYQLLY